MREVFAYLTVTLSPHRFRLDDFLRLVGVADVEDGAVPRPFYSHARPVDEKVLWQICQFHLYDKEGGGVEGTSKYSKKERNGDRYITNELKSKPLERFKIEWY